MRTFTDALDREWALTLNVASARRIRDLAEVDLLHIDGDVLQRLADDPAGLADVLCALCRPQIEAAGLDDERFAEGLAGDAIDRATEALLQELVAFFPQPRRGLMEKALAKLERLRGMTAAAAERALDGETLENVVKEELGNAEAELEAELRARLRASPGASST